MNTIADNAYVRELGSLPDPNSAGGVTDIQIDAALRLAYGRMVELFTKQGYEDVRSYAGVDADLKQKQESFKVAEAFFTISKLPFSISNAQMSETGIKDSVQTGKATTTFASMEEGRKDRRGWEDEAYRWLAPYLTGTIKNANSDTVGFRNRKGSFFITAATSPEEG